MLELLINTSVGLRLRQNSNQNQRALMNTMDARVRQARSVVWVGEVATIREKLRRNKLRATSPSADTR